MKKLYYKNIHRIFFDSLNFIVILNLFRILADIFTESLKN